MDATQLKTILAVAEALQHDPTDAEVGRIDMPEQVIIRTVTHYYTGRVTRRDAMFVELDDASWVASTGRWSDALRTGTLDEVEPFPNRVLVALGAIVDVAEWVHPLPRERK